MAKTSYYKSRMRAKGQITLPNQIREMLQVEEGDGVIFYIQKGRIVVEREQTISPNQAWFWSERWQQMEHAAQADIDSDHVTQYHSVEEALNALQGQEDDAED